MIRQPDLALFWKIKVSYNSFLNLWFIKSSLRQIFWSIWENIDLVIKSWTNRLTYLSLSVRHISCLSLFLSPFIIEFQKSFFNIRLLNYHILLCSRPLLDPCQSQGSNIRLDHYVPPCMCPIEAMLLSSGSFCAFVLRIWTSLFFTLVFIVMF